MKNLSKLPSSLILVSAIALLVASAATVSAQPQTNRVRIGVYDSRAVAVAYGNSTEFQDSMKATQAEFQKAKAAKNEKRCKELEAQMKLQQRRFHEQGFSTGSVAGTVEKIKPLLPNLARKARVQLIVSKWELNYQTPAVEAVDVTDDLVALFHVSEKGRAWAREVRAKPPVPLEDITAELD